jgi:hypothetical protein
MMAIEEGVAQGQAVGEYIVNRLQTKVNPFTEESKVK